jgi:uncharacterized membrane-anchored protein YitT (DUF2179 family)
MKKFLNLFTGFGLLMVGIAAIIYMSGVSFRNRAELTTGTVTGFSTVIHNSHVCNSPPAHQVGDQVEIYYDPENPGKAQVKNFWSQYLVVSILGCIGLPFVLFGGKMISTPNN